MPLIRTFWVLVPLTLCLSPAYAEQPVYRCTVNGSTIFSDKPCDQPASARASASGGSAPSRAVGSGAKAANSLSLDYSTPYGAWRGQAQYQANVQGQLLPEAHSVVPLVIEVEGPGKVRGVSSENGCKMLGVAAPHITPNLLTLDVTVSGCSYPAFNRRYFGTLALYKTSNSVALSLQSVRSGLTAVAQGGAHFDIKATMRR